jgi:hypothetical protein
MTRKMKVRGALVATLTLATLALGVAEAIRRKRQGMSLTRDDIAIIREFVERIKRSEYSASGSRAKNSLESIYADLVTQKGYVPSTVLKRKLGRLWRGQVPIPDEVLIYLEGILEDVEKSAIQLAPPTRD